MASSSRISRRQFIKTTAVSGLAGPLILASNSRGAPRPKPSNRINLGFIGVGTMGGGHVRRFLGFPDVQVLAVCDVAIERREHYRKAVDEHYTKSVGKG